ncbi:autotransporter serine protease [Oleiagrimonas sp. C23AA]|uniref:S8 family serine peptidase n=1 Tax=Oleiagrimonas sp. C23AA TaxID=2719047 RepID=UPI00141FD5F0|nr:autotransporter serine protease [Oleiagrimonas sp. C23AA]NII09457.1 S8 family serine peptidase [Oleiagrimonas sp. C23AA]
MDISYGMRLKALAAAVSLACMLGLSACGGGGGGNSNVRVDTPPPPPPPDGGGGGGGSTDEQPPIDAHLALTDTYAAHDEGFTGQGVTIGVIDTGVNRHHPALDGRVIANLNYVDPASNDLSVDDVAGHGTWGAQIAAGTSFGQWPGGIAPGADIVSARLINDTEPSDDGSGQGNQVSSPDPLPQINADLIDQGVKVMNNSWGGLYWDHNDGTTQRFAAAYDPFVNQWGGLVVFATGNDGNANPSDTAALPSLAPQLEKGWLAVAAIDANHPDQLADYSNACGIAMDYCLVAPGNVIATVTNDTVGNPSYYIITGTSFAAPQVSGAAALVWQAYPYFSNDLVRQTLLGTAKDLGDPGPDATFGYGLLDVGKAVHGPARFDWGDVSVSFDTGTSTWSNDISGEGGLIKDGGGTLVMSGRNTYAGRTQVTGGTLQASQGIAHGAFIGANGTLSATPSIGGGLDNEGVLVVSGGDTTIGGNYLQQMNGRLSVQLGSVLKVAGSATLSGGDLHVIGQADGYVGTDHQDVLTAKAGVSGQFDALTFASGVFVDTSIHYDSNDVWLDTQRVTITQVQGMSYTAASAASAQRLEGAFSTLDATGGSQSGAAAGDFVAAAGAIEHTASLQAAQATLESLSGQMHAVSAALALDAVDAAGRSLDQHLMARLDQGYQAGAGFWNANLSESGAMAQSGFQHVGYQLDGWQAGSDQWFSRHWLGGFVIGQSHGLQRASAGLDRNRSRATQLRGYLGWRQSHWYTQSSLGTGYYRQDIDRQLLLGGGMLPVGTLQHGRYAVAHLQSGYGFDVARLRVTPFAELQYVSLNRDGFREQGGAGFGLKAGAQQLERWRGGVGVRLARQWRQGASRWLRLGMTARYQQALATHGDVFAASYTGLDAWAPLTGIGLMCRNVRLGLQAQAALSSHLSLSMDYAHAWAAHQQSRTLDARVRWTF